MFFVVFYFRLIKFNKEKTQFNLKVANYYYFFKKKYITTVISVYQCKEKAKLNKQT